MTSPPRCPASVAVSADPGQRRRPRRLIVGELPGVTDPTLGLPRTLALRVLGNGLVPQLAAVALRLLQCPHRWAVPHGRSTCSSAKPVRSSRRCRTHRVGAIVTSPPFCSLRDYGTGRWAGGDRTCPHPVPLGHRVDGRACAAAARWADPQYGLEPTVEQYAQRLVDVFDQARRVLTPTGTGWLNVGDSYFGGGNVLF